MFKIGDRVKIIGGEDQQHHDWCDGMDKWVGHTVKITAEHGDANDTFYLEGIIGWAFHQSWLEPANAKKTCPSNLNLLAAEYDEALDGILSLTTKLAYAKNLLLKAKPMVTFDLNEQITTFIEQLEE